jgi:hypothetical protein
MLVPVVMNRLVKSSRCSQLPQSMSRPVPASRGWMPRAQARSASPSWRGFTAVTVFLPGRSGGDGTARDLWERGHAEVDGLFLPAQGRVDLGELVLGVGEADLEALDLSEPAPCERFRSASGIEWELRRAPGPKTQLASDSRLCSQRLYQLNVVLDGRSREGASIWLRTRNGRTISRFIRPWPGGELARHEGIAQPDDFAGPWEAYLATVAERRREMGS